MLIWFGMEGRVDEVGIRVGDRGERLSLEEAEESGEGML